MTRFSSLEPSRFSNSVVVVDIDGTLMPASGSGVAPGEYAALEGLKSVATVFLFSNRPDAERNIRIAASLGVPLISSPRRKPHPVVLKDVIVPGKETFVIGDKVLTDGLLALFTGATFVHVERVLHTDDAFLDKAISFFDDGAALVFSAISRIVPYIRLIRPVHWVKNGLVFAPLFFSGAFLNVGAFMTTVVAFLTFCALASAVYILNDIRDVEADRAHPTKRTRPIASGRVTSTQAFVMLLAALVATGIGAAYLPAIVPALLLYTILNVAYSFGVKHIPVLELVLVASLYVARVIGGGEAAGVPVSIWIVLCTFFGALILISGKRFAEFSHVAQRRVLSYYSKQGLSYTVYVSALGALISYVGWSIFATSSPIFTLSSIFVALALWRVSQLILSGGEGAERPESLVFKDRVIFGLFLIWTLMLAIALYGV